MTEAWNLTESQRKAIATDRFPSDVVIDTYVTSGLYFIAHTVDDDGRCYYREVYAPFTEQAVRA